MKRPRTTPTSTPAAPAPPSPLADLAAQLTIRTEAAELAAVPFALTPPTPAAGKPEGHQPALFNGSDRPCK